MFVVKLDGNLLRLHKADDIVVTWLKTMDNKSQNTGLMSIDKGTADWWQMTNGSILGDAMRITLTDKFYEKILSDLKIK